MMKQITAPHGSTVMVNGTQCRFDWNSDAIRARNDSFLRKQKYIDSEVLRRCSPRIPLQTGMLIRSGTLGTRIGSGTVEYIASYASHQYYETALTRRYDPNRGAKWFERMKTAEKDQILKGAQQL